MAGEKPDLKIAIKPSKGGKDERVYVLAFWRREDGKYGNGSLDRKIKGLRIYMEDGTTVDVKRDGKYLSHFVDAFEGDGQGAARRDPPPSRGEFPPDDGGGGFGDGDIPFAAVDPRLP